MNNFFKHIVFILLILSVKLLHAQSYNFKNYNTEQGLAQSQVITIYQDHIGNMWFGTNSGGLGKYDGNKFTSIKDVDGLVNNVVFAIVENNLNELVVGTSNGLSILSGKKIKNFTQKEGLKNSWIFDLLQDGDKTWIATQEGVYILENYTIKPIHLDSIISKSAVFKLFKDTKGNIWFGTTQNGAFCYNPQNKKLKQYSKKDGLTEELIFSITENEKQQVLLGSAAGLFLVENENLIPMSQISRQEFVGFRSLLNDNEGNLWMGTSSEGLYNLNKNKLSIFNLTNGLTNNSILSLFKDRENNLWIGTDGSGVYKYKNEKFSYYTKNDGLADNYINSVAHDYNDNYWIAMRNNGLCQINGKTVTHHKIKRNAPNQIPDNNITCILPTENKVYFGSNDGFFEYDGGKFKTLYSSEFKHQYILSLFKSKDNTIWIGTGDGLYSYKNNIFTKNSTIDVLKQSDVPLSIFSICEDKNEKLWIGIENGVVCIDNKNFTLFNNTNHFNSSRVQSIIKDSENNLWFGTMEGLYNYNYKDFTKISTKNGLSQNNLISLCIDNKNRLIIGLNNGIDILDLNDFYKNKINVQHLSKEDGLLSLESNFNASYKDKYGRIIIGTIDGVEIYDPRFDLKNKQEALTRIEDIKLFFGQEDIFKYANSSDSTSTIPQSLELPFNKNHLTFYFIGVSLTAPEKVKYQYMLEGVDDDWSPPTSKTEATYSSLQPGSYKFKVKAMNNDGVWNETPIVYEFTIMAPWYKTWWFYSICIIVLIASISFYNYYRTKKLIADKQKLERIVDERTHELREEKEKVELINKEVIEQKAIIEHKNVEITDSIKYAKNIQEALLPNLNNIHSLFPQSFVLYMPKDIVSGDFYWFAKNENTLFVAAVDCTGHGVPGAFMSIVGNTLLNEIVNEKKLTVPGDILLELHKGVKIALNQNAQEFERRDGMDIALCAITEGSNIIQYAGANRPLWIFRKDNNYELEAIKATKYPIGGLELEENRVYQNHEITINTGDTIYLFSDGYADQFGGPKGKKFMLTNMQKTISGVITLPMEDQKQKLTQAFNDWKSDTEQIDDVLVIGVKF